MKRLKIRYSRKRIFTGLFLFLCIFGIGIGYALVNTDLDILGVATMNDAKWNVHFDNYALEDGSVEESSIPTITDTSISFSAKVNVPGEFYGFTIDVVNEGTINAVISSFTLTPDFTNVDYIDATVEYDNGSPVSDGNILLSGTTKTIKVILSYKEGIDESLYPTTDQSYNVVLTLNYEQHVGSVPWTLPQGKTKDNLTLGDELCLDDQCFNFIKYDGNDVILLSKYNLKVGDIVTEDPEDIEDTIKIGEYTSSDIGYGLQSSETRGLVDGESTWNGVVPFSYTSYWYDYNTDTLIPYYGTAEPAYVYDATNYGGAPGTNTYSVAYYVEQYKTKLTNDYGATIKSARLLTYSEATETLGCTWNVHRCPTDSFITNTTFWLGSAVGETLYAISSKDYFFSSICDYFIIKGVRPVIVVEKSNL